MVHGYGGLVDEYELLAISFSLSQYNKDGVSPLPTFVPCLTIPFLPTFLPITYTLPYLPIFLPCPTLPHLPTFLLCHTLPYIRTFLLCNTLPYQPNFPSYLPTFLICPTLHYLPIFLPYTTLSYLPTFLPCLTLPYLPTFLLCPPLSYVYQPFKLTFHYLTAPNITHARNSVINVIINIISFVRQHYTWTKYLKRSC